MTISDSMDLQPLLVWLRNLPTNRRRPKSNEIPQIDDINMFLTDVENVCVLTKNIDRLSNSDKYKLSCVYTDILLQFSSLGDIIIHRHHPDLVKEVRRLAGQGIEK